MGGRVKAYSDKIGKFAIGDTPDNKIVSILNLKLFCDENNLKYEPMRLLCLGEKKVTMGTLRLKTKRVEL